MNGSQRKWVIGLVLIVGLAAVAVSGLQQSMASYQNDYDVVRANPDKVYQVPGVVDRGLPHGADPVTGDFTFTMRDVETRTQSLPVRSARTKPGNFDSAAQVVCRGTFRDGVFVAEDILVKCPSKEVEKLEATGG